MVKVFIMCRGVWNILNVGRQVTLISIQSEYESAIQRREASVRGVK